MTKLIKTLTVMMVVMFTTLGFAQTEKGKWIAGVNGTGLNFENSNGVNTLNADVTVGKFIAKNLAPVVTVGYNSLNADGYNVNNWVYGAGLKYYTLGKFPIQVDWRNTVGSGFDKSKVGFQGGYALFPFSNFSVEPAVRYEVSTNKTEPNTFKFGVGFNLLF